MDRRTCSRGLLIWLAILMLLAAAHASWAADEMVIKMATIAPQGSEWHQVLLEMGAAWEKASRGQVQFRLYPGGVAGDDADVVRKMRLGTLNVALLSSDGLTDIDRSVLALQVPLAYANYRELDCTIEQLGPQIEKQIEARGFVLLGWSDAGWAHFFTKEPVRTPDDMKKLKMFVWAGDDRYAELWKKAGFNPVPLPSTEISTALQTGLVNAVTSTVQGVVLLQWYRQVRYMTDLKWAVFLGAIVVSQANLGEATRRCASIAKGGGAQSLPAPQRILAAVGGQGHRSPAKTRSPGGRRGQRSARPVATAH